MGDEQLIEFVRRYETIYNIKCIKYRDATLRNAAWEEIAKQLGKPIEECKENWNKLRNCYNNVMKRRQKKSGEAGKKIAPWRFEEQMSFLKPYLVGRPTTGNLDVMRNEDPPSSPESPYTESQPSPESIPPRTIAPTSNVSYKRKASSMNDNHLADIVEIMRSSQENRNKSQEMDDLDAFFLSISKIVKKLPRLDQIRIKMDLLKTVSEAELKDLESIQNVLKTPITIRSQRSSHSSHHVNSASDSFAQPHTSSSPSYVAELPNTQFSSEAASFARPHTSSSPSYVVEPPDSKFPLKTVNYACEVANYVEIDEEQNIRCYYENNKME